MYVLFSTRFTTTIWKPLNGLGGFVGFLKSLGGLAKFRRDNPYVEDVIEVLQKRLVIKKIQKMKFQYNTKCPINRPTVFISD